MIRTLKPFDGPVWRLLSAILAKTPAVAASAPEGRFHYSGQTAAYASLSAEGTRVAIRRYMSDGVPRVLIPMWLSAERVADIRGEASASVIWQDDGDKGLHSPTWRYSDAARQAGADAMLYSSRTRPDLSHVVVFNTGCLSFIGPISAFDKFTDEQSCHSAFQYRTLRTPSPRA
jgi:RES domain